MRGARARRGRGVVWVSSCAPDATCAGSTRYCSWPMPSEGRSRCRRRASCSRTAQRGGLLLLLAAACGGSNQKSPPSLLPAKAVVAAPGPAPADADGHLPATAVPERYRVSLKVDPSKERFAGVASIDVRLPSPTSHVVLN